MTTATQTASMNLSDSIVSILGEGAISTQDLATKIGKKPGAINAILSKLEREKKVAKEEVDGTWTWKIAEPVAQEEQSAADENSAPAEFDTNLGGTEWSGAPKATLHKTAVRYAEQGNKAGKKFPIGGWWACVLNEKGEPVSWLDTFLKSAPEKMKAISALKWTWKSESTGLKNIEIVRQSIKNAKLVRVNDAGEIIKVYDC